MKAPSPTFTSRTIASAPAASFFDMIDEAMSGTMSTVAVHVAERRRASCPPGTRVAGLADDREADRRAPARTKASSYRARHGSPGIDSSLSRVPPVWPSPRPDIFPSGTPQAATMGPTASDVLSPTPPGRVLVDDAPAERAPEVERLAGADHRVGQRVGLASGEALEVDGPMHQAAIW
jgi:hypothetical protein